VNIGIAYSILGARLHIFDAIWRICRIDIDGAETDFKNVAISNPQHDQHAPKNVLKSDVPP